MPSATAAQRSRSPALDGGSSDIWWGSWCESADGEEHSQSLVLAVAQVAGEAAVELVDPVETPMFVKSSLRRVRRSR